MSQIHHDSKDTAELKACVVSSHLAGGPVGFGDPNDQSLRKVELEILIPKKMRDIAKTEKCVEEVENFTACCAGRTVSMAWACRKENNTLKDCLTRWYKDPNFRDFCTKEYLADRTEYRLTGVRQKEKKATGSLH